MAITHIHSASLYVNDPDRAIDFYANKLGFELRQDEAFSYGEDAPTVRWIEVAPPGAQTAIILIKGYAGWSEDQVGKFGGISFTVEDTYATCVQLKERGVEFTEDPNPQPWGIQAQIKDSEGNVLVMVGN